MKFMRYYLLSLLLICGLQSQAYAAADLGNTAVISPTDASNGSGTCPSWLGSAAPSTLDDSGRCFQGAVAREWQNRSFAITSAGSSTVYTLSYTVAPAAYREGQVFSFILDETTGASPTFNVNTLGAVTAKKLVAGTLTDIAAGDWVANDRISLAYTATGPAFVWVNQGNPNVFASTTEQLTGTNATKASTADSVAALWEEAADVSDGAAITIGEGGYFELITSTTAITSFSITTDKAGRSFHVRFNTARTLTHNATSLIMPGGLSRTTVAGDIAFIRSLGGGNVVVEAYIPNQFSPDSGTYTPTLSNTTNVAASTAYLVTWSRVGNVVNVAGRIDIDPTTTDTATVLGVSLPVASDFAQNFEAGGMAVAVAAVNTSLACISDAANNRITLQGVVRTDTNHAVHFICTYRVL